MNLPAEILNHILSFLQSDPVALRACCESHPSLSKLAEPYLYAHISLRTDDMFPEQNLGVFDLSKLLSNSPHLVHYIFSLHIVFVKCEPDGPDLQVNRHVEEISAILPLLLALRTITLGRMSGSPGQLPESFTVVFLDCLLLPSMHKVRILNFDDIPLMEHEPIRRSTISQSFELLHLRHCGGPLLDKFSTWLQSQGLQFRSLQFTPADDDVTFEPLPSVLATSSNSLTTLYLDLGISRACFYDLYSSYIDHQDQVIPVTLCTLPYLERLTLRVELRYLFGTEYGINHTWGFWSAIPQITQLFSSNTSSIPTSLKHITLHLNCTANDQPLFGSFSLSEVFVTPLVHLLSSISAFKSSRASAINVILYLHGSASDEVPSGDDESRLMPMPLHILSPLFKSGELMPFVEQGMLSIFLGFSITLSVGAK